MRRIYQQIFALLLVLSCLWASAALADGDNALAERLMLEHIDTLAACLDASRAGSGSARDRLRSALAPDMPAAGARATQRRLKKM